MGQRFNLNNIANIALIVTCLGMLVHLVDRHSGGSLDSAVSSYWRDRALKNSRFPAFAGRPTILIGLSPSCSYCVREVPRYRQMLDHASRLRDGPRLVSVFTQGRATAAAFLNDHKLNVEIVDDATISAHIRVTPTLILLDRTGAVRDVWSGAGKRSVEEMLAAARQLM